jgi:hypothetical protein
VAARLKVWLDGECREDCAGIPAADIERHVVACPRCSDVAEDYRRLSCSLGAGIVSGVDARGVAAGILARAGEETRVVGFLRGIAAVAALVLGVSLSWLLLAPERSPFPGEELADLRDSAVFLVLDASSWEDEP